MKDPKGSGPLTGCGYVGPQLLWLLAGYSPANSTEKTIRHYIPIRPTRGQAEVRQAPLRGALRTERGLVAPGPSYKTGLALHREVEKERSQKVKRKKS